MYKYLLLPALILVLIASCDDKGSGPEIKPGLYVTLKDSVTNEIIEDSVGVFYTWETYEGELENNFYCYPNPVYNLATFHIQITKNCYCKFVIEQSGKIISEIFERDFYPATNIFEIDINELGLADGFYTAKLISDDTVMSCRFFCYTGFYLYSTDEITKPFLIKQPASSKQVYFAYSDFPFIGETYERIFENGESAGKYIISDTIGIMTRSQGYQRAIKFVKLEQDKHQEVEILLQPE